MAGTRAMGGWLLAGVAFIHAGPSAADMISAAPSFEHPFGVSPYGEDLLSLTMAATATTLAQSILAAGLTGVIAVALGTIAAARPGGVIDSAERVVGRLLDALGVFLIAAALTSVVPRVSIWQAAAALSLVAWPNLSRIVRAETLRILRSQQLQAARAIGVGPFRLLERHILPEMLDRMVSPTIALAGTYVGVFGALQFLGLGVSGQTTLGFMLWDGSQNYLHNDPWYFASALGGFVVILVVLAAIASRVSGDQRVSAPTRGTGAPRSVERPSAATAVDDSAVKVQHLSVAYRANGTRVAGVEDVSLASKPRGTTWVLGESGSGKTTLARAILGILPSSAEILGGRILFRGLDVLRGSSSELEAIRGQEIGLALQEPATALDPRHSVAEIFAEAVAAHSDSTREDADHHCAELLRRLGIEETERVMASLPTSLSGGQLQRVIVAVALASKPGILIVDEPTAGLDMISQAALVRLLRAIREERELSLIVITHDLDLIDDSDDHVAVMRDGRIVEFGPARRVLSAPSHEYSRRLVDTCRRLHEPAPSVAEEGAAGQPPLLAVRNLQVRYGAGHRLGRSSSQVVAVDGIDLGVASGHVLGVIGRSGSGKSSAAHAIVQLVRPSGGEVYFEGRDLGQLGRSELRRMRRGFQIVFQDAYGSLSRRMTARAHLLEAMSAHAIGEGLRERNDRAESVLSEVGLGAELLERTPDDLSAGQRARLAISRALIVEPKLLICDEMTSSLDLIHQATILDLLAELKRRRGLALLFISHDLRVVRRVADWTAVMEAGKIVEYGPSAEVFANPRAPATAALIEAEPRGLKS